MVFHELCVFADQEHSKRMEETMARQKSEFREHLEHLKKIGQLTEEEVEQIWKSEGMMEPESDVEQVQVWRRWGPRIWTNDWDLKSEARWRYFWNLLESFLAFDSSTWRPLNPKLPIELDMNPEESTPPEWLDCTNRRT